LKILHVYKDYYPVVGGIENHIGTLARAQVSKGDDVTVLVTNPGGLPGKTHMDGVDVIRLWRLATVASTPLSFGFVPYLSRAQPDITHLHFPYPVGEISQLIAGAGRPFVITYHSDIVRQQTLLRLYHPVLLWVLQRAASILATSNSYIESSPILRQMCSKCVVVPLSVDPALFQKAQPLISPGSVPSLLFVGRHRYYKGLDDLIRVMPDLNARLLVGGDGPLRPSWEALCLELGVGEKVHFLGDVSNADLPRLYASADIFVLPANARAEAFGKVLLEAMAAGLPCVTTELGTGTSFVVQDGKTGFVVPPRQPGALRDAVNKLLEDVVLRRSMGEAGRRRVVNEFTVDKMAVRVDAVYQAVLNGK
jgi:rhamnosyl/mannosyltransferase